jgi:hypothetical protein
LLPKVFPSHDVACALQQYRKHFQRLALQSQLYAAFAQLSRAEIEFKSVEPQNARGWRGDMHVEFRKLGKAYHSSWSLETFLNGPRTPFFFNTLAMEKTLGTDWGSKD